MHRYPQNETNSSHPGGGERVSDLENLITHNSYNRYTYEGVGHHTEIQSRVKKLIAEKKAREKKNKFLLNQKPELFVT
jgi:hypothetical protein